MANRMCTLFLDQKGHAEDLKTLARLSTQVGVRKVVRKEGLDGLRLVAQTLLATTS
jgi:hypothetical protein